MPPRSASTRFADVRRFETVASTNAAAAELARPGLVVVADHQSAGRGRLGRSWEAPPGSSLLVSVVLDAAWLDGPQLGTVALALAASDACEAAAGVRPLLKWPNDLVVGEGKLGGILAEALPRAGVVVAGLGLNVRWGTRAPPPPGVSLDALGARLAPADLLAGLLAALDARLDQDASALLDDYRARSATLGQVVRVETGGGPVDGTAVDITTDGHLVVADVAGARQTIPAGDVVHLRPA
jgi:BirA family transcriptional regulator, biotin operon repressor / biotin---[acetyl-CoA-carboxylase] ligase